MSGIKTCRVIFYSYDYPHCDSRQKTWNAFDEQIITDDVQKIAKAINRWNSRIVVDEIERLSAAIRDREGWLENERKKEEAIAALTEEQRVALGVHQPTNKWFMQSWKNEIEQYKTHREQLQDASLEYIHQRGLVSYKWGFEEIPVETIDDLEKRLNTDEFGLTRK